MQSRGAVLTITVLSLVGTVLTSPCGAVELTTSFSITAEGKVTAGESAVVPDPPDCLGPLSLVGGRVTVSNGDSMAESPVVTVALSPGVHFDRGTPCTPSSGTCTIIDPSTLEWTVTVPAMSSATLLFTARVDADVPAGTQICATISAMLDGSTMPITVCTTTNSAHQCGLGAPALSEISLALMILALGAGGTLLLSRRRS